MQFPFVIRMRDFRMLDQYYNIGILLRVAHAHLTPASAKTI